MIPRFKPWLGWPEFFALFKTNKGAVEKFEKEFARSFQAVDAVAFPYGRSAQWAFFKAMGVENAEIIMPAYTCSVVAHAVSLSGNTPRFIDIDLYDYNMNLDQAEAAINENTRAIIATHTFGYPQDLDRLEAMVQRAEQRFGHKVWLVQDCCHAFGAEWKGRMIGTSGDVAVYAFNISKLMTSIFGGMLTFQDQALADKVRAWRDANYRPASSLKALQRRLYLLAIYPAFNEKIYGLTWWVQEKTPLLNHFTKSYHLDDKVHFPPDYKDRMVEVEAAVGLAQLQRYDAIIARRRANAAWYDQNLPKRLDWIFPPIVDGATYSHYVVRVPERKPVIDEWASRDIQLGELIQYSIPLLPEYSGYVLSKSDSSEMASHKTINFPLHFFQELNLGCKTMRETNFSTKNAKSESDVIAFYDEYAISWDDRFGESFATEYFINRRWRSFQDAIDKCQPSRDVAVELGVGTGVYINRASEIFNKIRAVDGSRKMLDMLQSKIQTHKIAKVELIEANVLNVEEVPDSSADCVYFFGLIEHIVNIDAFKSEIKRILKRGGILIGVTPNGRSPWYSFRQAVRGTGKHCSTDTYYTIRDLDNIFIPIGFKKSYVSHWGAVPAGVGNLTGNFLSRIEPIIEKSPLRIYLGGLTFAYTCE